MRTPRGREGHAQTRGDKQTGSVKIGPEQALVYERFVCLDPLGMITHLGG